MTCSTLRPFVRLALLPALFIVLALLPYSIPTVYAANMNVDSAADVLAPDGQCTLREAIISANTNPEGLIVLGECPQGSDSETDTIVLENGAIYTLTIGNGDNTAQQGDLDLIDNSAEVDLVITTANPEGPRAVIDASGLAGGDRVFQVLSGANVRLEKSASSMDRAHLMAAASSTTAPWRLRICCWKRTGSPMGPSKVAASTTPSAPA